MALISGYKLRINIAWTTVTWKNCKQFIKIKNLSEMMIIILDVVFALVDLFARLHYVGWLVITSKCATYNQKSKC